MKTLTITAIALLGIYGANAQNTGKYLEQIRDNSAALTAFFSAMPKGGDLHHHYSGSIYTETFINRVVANDYFINRTTCIVLEDTNKRGGAGFVRFSALRNPQARYDSIPYYKQQLVQKWSVKDYNGVSYPSDKQFFETFDYFNVTSKDSLKQGLLELKNRALKENVSYIETMFLSIPCDIDVSKLSRYNELLRQAQTERNEVEAQRLLKEIYSLLPAKTMEACAEDFNTSVAKLHVEAGVDDERFTMRYQNYIVRLLPPVLVFRNLALAFESANRSPLIVGVNIVAPENHEVSMQDYWLHMQMYKFCHDQYAKVEYSMHAGELVLGMVQPEELTWHITEAVHTAGAKRIGHGVDMPYEAKSYDLLRYMAKNKIAVEINLVSNEFILKVKNDRHPVTMYNKFGVPIVISTDDAGVLRTNMIEQYVLLAKRYPEISYQDIKHFVFNSIKYSFIEEPALKQKLTADLERRFKKFEEEIDGVMSGK